MLYAFSISNIVRAGMTIRSSFAILFALLVFQSVHAQMSVYGGIDLTNYGFASGNTGTFSYSPGSGKFSYYSDGVGFDAGATHLFSSRSRLKAGVDLRAMYSPGSRGGAGGFGSLRVAFVPNRNPLSPYFQLGGGILTTTYPSGGSGQRNRATDGAVDFAFGENVHTRSRLSIRAIELGGYAGSNVVTPLWAQVSSIPSPAKQTGVTVSA
jgi:hypothetical protein